MTTAASALVEIDEGLWQVRSGVFESNCYVRALASPSSCVVIDPGLDPAAIDERLRQLGRTPRAVLCTHGHFDHIGGAAYFQDAHRIPVYLDPGDVKTMKSSNFLLMALRIGVRIKLPEVTATAPGPGGAEVEGQPFEYIRCPGHTPGSCAIQAGRHLFTGDSLYARGVGLSQLPGEDREQLRASIRGLRQALPDDVTVCPGHGPTAELGVVFRENQALLKFLEQDG